MPLGPLVADVGHLLVIVELDDGRDARQAVTVLDGREPPSLLQQLEDVSHPAFACVHPFVHVLSTGGVQLEPQVRAVCQLSV